MSQNILEKENLLKSTIFDECFKHYKENFKIGENWHTLSEKFGYSSAEALRSDFRRERKKRGIKKDEVALVAPPVQKANHNAKILLFDIETTPLLAFSWGLWEQNISTKAIVQDWHLLTWSAKWIFSGEIISMGLTSEEAKRHDDRRIVSEMWKILNQADIVIGHNSDSFDIRRLNTRFLIHGLPPVKPYKSIDTYKVAKQYFSFSSSKLDYVNECLDLPQKDHTDLKLWIDCFYGNADALKEMETYNRNDVEILEDLYLKVRPFIRNHPNLNLWTGENVSVCPNCASEKLNWDELYYTDTGYYKGYVCLNCGAHGRSRQIETPKEKSKTIVR